jgi:DNA-binding NarL/FixJ family response regulator
MPGMNGFEVAREIAAIAAPTRMIMFTANDWEGLVREAQNVGIGDGVAVIFWRQYGIRKLFHERDAP